MLQLSAAGEKPYIISLSQSLEGQAEIFRIYAWNATHGGGERRAADEYRVQFTGARPEIVAGQRTVVLGWSEKFQVFVGWDATIHKDRGSASPSLQVRQATLESAKVHGFAVAERKSGDIVVAIAPHFLSVYFWNAERLHQEGSGELVEALNAIPQEAPELNPLPLEADEAQDDRQQIVRTIRSNYRAWDFRVRVLEAYGDMCAVCGLQLGLVEAAHIVPVAWPGSTDETSNGIALCRNHHKAYDSALISFSDDMNVLVADSIRNRFDVRARSGGSDDLEALEGLAVVKLPEAFRDRPLASYVALGRIARNW